MKRKELVEIVREVMNEESLSSAQEIIDYVGDEIKPQHWSVIYQQIKNGKISVHDFHKILKYFKIEENGGLK